MPGLDIPGLDFVSLAAGYGVAGERVNKPDALADVLRQGLAKPGPYLIAVEVSRRRSRPSPARVAPA